jgi:hypothetical protein
MTDVGVVYHGAADHFLAAALLSLSSPVEKNAHTFSVYHWHDSPVYGIVVFITGFIRLCILVVQYMPVISFSLIHQ